MQRRSAVPTRTTESPANVTRGHGARARLRRVGEDVATLAPHRPGRADFPHPVPRGEVSLTAASRLTILAINDPSRCHPSLAERETPRQCGYPSPFRRQVCRAHVPSRVSRRWLFPRDASLPSRGSRRARFPALGGTMKALRLPTRASTDTHWFAPAAHATLPRSCSPWRSRKVEGPSRAWLFAGAGGPSPACSRVDANGISQVFRRSFLCLCSAPGPRSNQRALAMSVTSMLPPLGGRRRLRRI